MCCHPAWELFLVALADAINDRVVYDWAFFCVSCHSRCDSMRGDESYPIRDHETQA